MVIRTLITNGDGGLQVSLPPLPCASFFPIPARLELAVSVTSYLAEGKSGLYVSVFLRLATASSFCPSVSCALARLNHTLWRVGLRSKALQRMHICNHLVRLSYLC